MAAFETPRRRLANRLVKAREDMQLTQEEVEVKTGIKANNLSRYELATRSVPADVLEILARFYGAPLLWFYGQLEDADVINLTDGLDPALAAKARLLPTEHQRALADFLPHLLTFAGGLSSQGASRAGA